MTWITKSAGIVAIIALLGVLIPSYILSGWVAIYLSPSYGFDHIPSQYGKTILVTGANTGIGYVTTRELARKGARVIATSRSKQKGAEALQRLQSELLSDKSYKNGAEGTVEFLNLDLASMQSVKEFTEEFLQVVDRVDVIILNAGVMFPPFQKTVDGLELTMGTNHFGHFLLVKRLLPLILSSKSRLVHVSSLAHLYSYASGINVKSFTEESEYDKFKSYGQSKLANILFSNELSKRYASFGVTSNAVHPGAIITDLKRHMQSSIAGDEMTLFAKIYEKISGLGEKAILMDTESGAFNQLYVATSANVAAITGTYFTPVGQVTSPSASATNETLQEELWEISEKLTKEFQ